MTRVHYRRPKTTDETVSLLLGATDARHPVTVGYWEQRKELRPVKKRDGSVREEWCPVKDQHVFTVRTLEIFDVDESANGWVFFTAMDRCPRDDADWLSWGPPRIRRVRADRIDDVTVHVKSSYVLRNEYFIARVRAHAELQRWTDIVELTDDALWKLIELASSTDDAILRAQQHVNA